MDRQITNPATLATLGSVPECGVDDLEGAVLAAARAAPAWRAAGASEHASALRQIGARIAAAAGELATLAGRESGQPLCESLDAVHAAAASFEFFATQAQSRPEPDSADPMGAAAVLAPFNLALPAMAAAAAGALAAGRCVLCKPPLQNPLASLELAKFFGVLPAGTISLLTGGAQLGRALAAHPKVDTVAFCGSVSGGREIEELARGKVLELETPGGGAHIVCRSADLEVAVAAIAWTRLTHGGQGWPSGHLYVERSIVAEFVDRMHPCVGFLDVDDPGKPSTDLGPLITADAARQIEDQVGRTLREGAKLILGGRRFRPSGLPGHFFQPTILSDVRPDGVPAQEPIAGPVITITPVADLAEALRHWRQSAGAARAASTVLIYTGEPDAACRELEAQSEGLFRVNDPSIGALGPFGALSHRAIRFALGAGPRSARTVETAAAIEPKRWWFPYSSRA